MTKIYFLILFVTVFVSGYTQVKLTIFNLSSEVIDSIVIEGTTPFRIGSIEKGLKKSFVVGADQANFHSFNPFYIKVYSAVSKSKMQWHKTGFNDTIYFFNHGLSLLNKEPSRPKTFRLYVLNATSGKIDTVAISNDAIIERTELSPRSFEVIFDHQKIELQQTISFKLAQKVFTVDLKEFNLNDWNNSNGSIYIAKDSVFVGNRKIANSFEYIIDFEVQEGLSLKEIQIIAKSLVKTYTFNGHSLRAVFDYAKFQSNPRLKVKVGRKTHLIKLNTKDIKNTNYQKLWISKEKIR